jgi:hypothetical protein
VKEVGDILSDSRDLGSAINERAKIRRLAAEFKNMSPGYLDQISICDRLMLVAIKCCLEQKNVRGEG